jgi:hypothetical protein
MAFDEFTEYGSSIKYLFLFSQPPLSLCGDSVNVRQPPSSPQ